MSSLPETQGLYDPAPLLSLVRDFDRQPVANRAKIEELLRYQPEMFYLAAIEILKGGATSRAAQHVLALLISGDLLFRALCDPVVERQTAEELARYAQQGDPTADIRLARQLADACTGETYIAPGMAERLLEIFDGISDGSRLLPNLMRMLRSSNPYLRSKAVLMIGRSGRSLKWIEKRLQESDTRVRANAIEAVWGIDTAEARELLEWASHDGNNRVAGNALFGLYQLGETPVLGELLKMAGHNSPAFRRTAAWVMGETGDPRFSEVLGRMIGDRDGTVRKSAFSAVRRLRAAILRASQTAEWEIAIAVGAKDLRSGERRVSAAVVTNDVRDSPRVSPVQFILTENGQTVWDYRVSEKMAPGPLAVLFLFPRELDRQWDLGSLRCLTWKRSTDLWSAVPYSMDGDSSGERDTDWELPKFIANSAEAARTLHETPKRAECTGFWTAIERAASTGNTPSRAQRHMIVLAPGDVKGRGDDNLMAAVRSSRTTIQVISNRANPEVAEFCRQIEGRFQYVPDGGATVDAVSKAYLTLLARYEIRYRPAISGAATLKVRLHTPEGWGEAALDL